MILLRKFKVYFNLFSYINFLRNYHLHAKDAQHTLMEAICNILSKIIYSWSQTKAYSLIHPMKFYMKFYLM